MLQNSHHQDQFIKLIGLSSFLEQQASLDESLDEIVAKSANILNIKNCSIMLFREDDMGDGMSLRIFAKFGEFPPKAATEAVKVNKGIAGKVAATAQPLLIQDIERSEYFPLARTPESPNKSFICVPIIISGKVIGVLNVSNPVDNRCFDYNDLNLSVFVTLLIGRSVQVIQLQNLLKSRFAQMAIIQETGAVMDSVLDTENYDADMLVKMLSKSFYREMTKAGFTKNHIIKAATEIISQLHESLARHDKRVKRETDPDL
ncbi:GAF domain-containing protein [Pelotalea chapellei]|uniref:GAF domain-containing protein n=1 Tax=Pelotalea chapellei TaxID=44671 RepID=A0ABS5U5H6_9BACT|nr:GAF domain-containing protein [Pelotalea chapellei]MBT1070910.1 GAF domain-containing protein [Pelotalea chapellei]